MEVHANKNDEGMFCLPENPQEGKASTIFALEAPSWKLDCAKLGGRL